MCIGAYPAMAQEASSGTASAPTAKEKKIEVRDYKSFKEYVANEEANLKTSPVTTDNGPIKEKMKKMGLLFKPGTSYSSVRDGRKVAYQSKNKKGIVVAEKDSGLVTVYNAYGNKVESVKFSKIPEGGMDFSKSRLFVIRGCFRGPLGFEIYDYSGKLIKTVENECVENHLVSNTGKYFVTTSGSRHGRYSVLYDMNGNELIRHNIFYGDTRISFSNNDEFALIEIPLYWENPDKEYFQKNMAYVFDILKKTLITEGKYEN